MTGIAAGADERIYHFVDESGVSHYSNVPMDPRYTVVGTEAGRLPATVQGPVEPEAPTPGPEAPLSIAPAPLEEEFSPNVR